MSSLAIIPARSGSKGLKDKNIKVLKDKPLMAYSILAAIDSGVFDEVMVSTDSEKYAKIAKEYGAKVPFLRSAATADDLATTWDTCKEVISEYRKQGREFDEICVLQPTSPLRSAIDIKQAYELYRNKQALAVISVCKTEHSPLLSNILGADLSMEGFISDNNNKCRQGYKDYYRLNGAIYLLNRFEFEKEPYFYRKGAYAYIMPQERSVDIDSEIDFRFCEVLMETDNKYIGR